MQVAILVAFSACVLLGCGADEFDELLAEGESRYSQGKSELVIRHFFRDRRNGFFVDIGCFEPIRASTTYYLEQHLGWTGIGVDAVAKFARPWSRYRPKSRFFAYAITDTSGATVRFYEHDLGISSLEKENIEVWEKILKKDLEEKVIQVPTITMNDLLEREGVTHIDFLSMDINGTEPAALRGFDIQRYRPELVHIEAHEKNQEWLRSYFDENGYELVEDYLKYELVNWYFTPKDAPP